MRRDSLQYQMRRRHRKGNRLMLKIEKKTFTSTVYAKDQLELGRLAVYGGLRRYLDKNPSLHITDVKESIYTNRIGGIITISLHVITKNYL